jgi:hypothetical protein
MASAHELESGLGPVQFELDECSRAAFKQYDDEVDALFVGFAQDLKARVGLMLPDGCVYG